MYYIFLLYILILNSSKLQSFSTTGDNPLFSRVLQREEERTLFNEWKHRMHAPLLKFLRLEKYFLERNGNEASFHEAVDGAEGSQGWLRTARQALSR